MKVAGKDENLGDLVFQEIDEAIAHGLVADKTCRAVGRLAKCCLRTKNNPLNAIFTSPEKKCWPNRPVLEAARPTPMNL